MPRPLHGPACKEAQLTAQAHFYIYGATRVSKRTFDDEFFRDVLRVQNPQCGFLARSKIKYHVAAEYLLFEVAFGWMLENLHKDFQGNPFAQGMHDGVTLANKKCYQSMGYQGIYRGVSYTLAFGFRHLRSHVAKLVGEEFAATLKRYTHLGVLVIFYSMISDLAALKVATELLIKDIQKCKLHQGGKVGSSGMGLLVKSKNNVVLNPFPAGVALYKKMHKLACEFSYGDRAQELDDICTELKMKPVKCQVDLNTTRMASLHNLFFANLRLRPAIMTYIARATVKVADLTTDAGMREYDRLVGITPTDAEWQTAGEMESGLLVAACQITLSQTEKSFTAAMDVPIERHLRCQLSPYMDQQVIVSDHPSMTAKPQRKSVNYENMTKNGREFFDRAVIAAEERFNSSMSTSQLVKSMSDIRTVKFCTQYMSTDEIQDAKAATKDAYIEYCTKAHAHKYGQKSGRDATELDGHDSPTPKKRWGAASVLGHSVVQSPSPDATATGPRLSDLNLEFEIAYANWINFCSDVVFVDEYPKELEGKSEDDLCLVRDLMGLDISKLYTRADLDTNMHRMPMVARQRVGENMAASFCERMNSIAKDIMDDGHTLLDSKELECMVILRANREFMKKVRGDWREEITLYANMKGIGLL